MALQLTGGAVSDIVADRSVDPIGLIVADRSADPFGRQPWVAGDTEAD